jgi:outer membrane protein W
MRKVSLALAVLVLVASIPAMAGQGDKIIRFGAAWSSPTGDFVDTFESVDYREVATLEADSAIGPFFGFEFMVSDLIGIDGTIIYTTHDIDSDFFVEEGGEVVFDDCMTIGDVSVMPLFVSAHFHVVQNDLLDYYIGPTIGYVMYGDLKLIPEFEEDDVPLKDDFGIGVVTGIDVPFGSGGWNFVTALRYIKTAAEIDEPEVTGIEIDIDPWILQVGVGKRW